MASLTSPANLTDAVVLVVNLETLRSEVAQRISGLTIHSSIFGELG